MAIKKTGIKKTNRKKRSISFLLVFAMLLSLLPTAVFSVTGGQEGAAEKLYSLKLFLGVGVDENGEPDFALGDGATRLQGLVMLIRLLGAEEDALSGGYVCPFEDVPDWGVPYVAYAYEHGLTVGVSETSFDPDASISPAQYLTFVLRALGYQDGVDFVWNRAWELTDELGITRGEFNASSAALTRGSIAEISLAALTMYNVITGNYLIEDLVAGGAVSEAGAKELIEEVEVKRRQAGNGESEGMGEGEGEGKGKGEGEGEGEGKGESEEDGQEPVEPTPTPTPPPATSGGSGGNGGGNGSGDRGSPSVPVASVSVSPDTATIGTLITATASGAGGATPTGTITYRWYVSGGDIAHNAKKRETWEDWESYYETSWFLVGENRTFIPGFDTSSWTGEYLMVVARGANNIEAWHKFASVIQPVYGIDYSALEYTIDQLIESIENVVGSDDGTDVFTNEYWVTEESLEVYIQEILNAIYHYVFELAYSQQYIDEYVENLDVLLNDFNDSKQAGIKQTVEITGYNWIPAVTVSINEHLYSASQAASAKLPGVVELICEGVGIVGVEITKWECFSYDPTSTLPQIFTAAFEMPRGFVQPSTPIVVDAIITLEVVQTPGK